MTPDDWQEQSKAKRSARQGQSNRKKTTTTTIVFQRSYYRVFNDIKSDLGDKRNWPLVATNESILYICLNQSSIESACVLVKFKNKESKLRIHFIIFICKFHQKKINENNNNLNVHIHRLQKSVTVSLSIYIDNTCMYILCALLWNYVISEWKTIYTYVVVLRLSVKKISTLSIVNFLLSMLW